MITKGREQQNEIKVLASIGLFGDNDGGSKQKQK